MKVLHLNFSDNGGAAIACRRTHLALLASGMESKMLVAKKSLDIPEVYELSFPRLRKIWRVLQLKYESWQKRLIPQSDKSLRHGNSLSGFILKEIKRFNPDIVHLHWINAGMMSLKDIQKLDVPTVWTAHDLWPITGSCHCAGSLMTESMAEQYPQTFENVDTSGYSARYGKEFRKLMLRQPEGLITLCRPFEALARKAQWCSNRIITRIPNCLDLSLFSPVNDKERLRSKLGLPEDKILLLFVAASLNAYHKGIDLLLESLQQMDKDMRDRCELVIVGGAVNLDSTLEMNCHVMGSISSEEKIARIYQACDVFLCPSREDNFPNTVAESSSCGLPAVAYRTGGLPDMIDHLENGYLAIAFDSADFANGINLAVNRRVHWSQNSRIKAESLYSSQEHVSKIIAFYASFLSH